MSFRIRVPATSANIGPGFDAMGVALSLYNNFELKRARKTTVSGCEARFANNDNLFLQSLRSACKKLEIEVPDIELSIDAHIPLARGLGSSAAMIVGGVSAAFLFVGRGTQGFSLEDKQAIFEISAALEGHPDNAGPAVFGGFCSSILKEGEDGKAFYSTCTVDPSWHFHALIPPFELSTSKARAALPNSVPRKDAVFNLGRAALVALAFFTRDPELLGAACEDRLHQDYRAPLIPGYDEIAGLCRKHAQAVWLSGAGPTIMALSAGEEKGLAFAENLDPFLATRQEGVWNRLTLISDLKGLTTEVF